MHVHQQGISHFHTHTHLHKPRALGIPTLPLLTICNRCSLATPLTQNCPFVALNYPRTTQVTHIACNYLAYLQYAHTYTAAVMAGMREALGLCLETEGFACEIRRAVSDPPPRAAGRRGRCAPRRNRARTCRSARRPPSANRSDGAGRGR